MSDEDKGRDAESSMTGSARPNSLGTGSRSPSGTISIDSSPTPSYDDMALRATSTRSNDTDEDEAVRSRAYTAPSRAQEPSQIQPPARQRLYSEEDEELRKAKAMATYIQQHPNMTPEDIHKMHFGDEQQSQIIEQQKKPKSDSFLISFRESQERAKKNLKESQERAKQKIKSMVSGTSAVPTPRGSKHGNNWGLFDNSVAPATFTSSPTTTTTNAASEDAQQQKAAPVDKRPGLSPAAVAKRAAAGKAPTPTAAVLAARSMAAPAAAAAATVKAKIGTAAKTTITMPPPPVKAATDKTKSRAVDVSSRSATPVVTEASSTEMSESKSFDSGKVKVAVLDEGKKIRLSATVWKRRSGLGKLSYTKAWERRKIILQGSKLFYFKMAESENEDLGLETKEASWFEQAAQNLDKAKGTWLPAADDPSAPRGYFDLLKEGATVAASSGHSGAPSPFAISIKVKSDTYWKLCFDSHATQMEWLAALTDVIVTASVDTYNANLLLAADPSNEPSMFGCEYFPPPGGREAGQQLWMMGEYRVSSEGLDEGVAMTSQEVVVVEKEPEVASTTTSLDELHDVDRWILQDKDLRVLFAIVNMALFLSRASLTEPQQFWYYLTFCNIGLWFCLVQGYRKRILSAPTFSAISVQKSVHITEVIEEEDEIPAIKPIAGTTTVKLQKTSDSPEVDGQVFGAWCAPGGETLAVRSHGYMVTKEKVPSPGELYECTNVDIFESPHRYPDMAKRVTLPKVEFEDDSPGPKTWHAPDIFIVSVALPTDAPKVRSTNDGGGFTITMYFTMKQETRDILRRVTAESYDPLKEPVPDDVQKSKVNAVKLFNEYCRRAPSDPSFQSRFKLVANAQNLKEIGLPTWIAKYNGKPVLIKRAGQTGFLFSHPEMSCIEFDVSFHPFPYLAKQAISYMKDNFFKKVLVTFGFVIEGRSDDELPECVIGLMQLCYPDPTYAIQAADFFAGKSPKSF